jgi:hypothetical protein
VTDPHGDRAWADDKFATRLDLTTVSDTVNAITTRIVDIETGTTPVSGINSVGPITVSGAKLTVTDSTKGYRFRVDGSSLDLEATGTDLIVSNWSGTSFDGIQRNYDRYSANALNVQHAGRREFVAALYGTVRHVIDPDNDQLGFHGAVPVARQTVTGSRTDGTALASLLTALATLGLIVDESTT